MWPKRVIDVRDDIPRLIETETATRDLVELPRYATLSHCWGQQDLTKTTRRNLKDRMIEIPWHELSKTFRDAITLTRRIKCNFIWIDSLCIIQDDDDDWKEQASKMEDIYSNSFLNIAGTSRFAQSSGPFSIRECHSDPWPGTTLAESHHITADLDGSNGSVFARYNLEAGHRYFSQDISNGRQIAPLLERAWVFQERLLAPRTLHFYTSELIWECRSTLRCECQGLDHISRRKAAQSALQNRISWNEYEIPCRTLFGEICHSGAPLQAVLDFWLAAISLYSGLNLTFEEDRPVALAGIAQRISNFVRSPYLAGLWAADLPRSLLWYRLDAQGRKFSRSSKIAPTWSWASSSAATGFNCGAYYFLVFSNGFVKDKRVEINPSATLCDIPGDNPFSTFKHGYLEIAAASLIVTINRDYDLNLGSGAVLNGTSQDYDWAIGGPDQILPGEEAYCLLVGRAIKVENLQYCLILQPARDKFGHYKRIGSIAIHGEIFSGLFDYAEIITMKII